MKSGPASVEVGIEAYAWTLANGICGECLGGYALCVMWRTRHPVEQGDEDEGPVAQGGVHDEARGQVGADGIGTTRAEDRTGHGHKDKLHADLE